MEQIAVSRIGEGLQDFRPRLSSSSSFHDPARVSEALDEPGDGGFSHFSHYSKKVRHNLRARGRHCLRTRGHGRRLLMTRPWCLRRRKRRRRSPRTSLSSLLSTCSTMGVGGSASGTQLTSIIAGGWPLPMGPRLAILFGGLLGSSAVGQGDDASMVLLGWCLVRQWIHVPASTYYVGCLFQFIVKVVDTALIYRGRYAQFTLCKVVDNPVMVRMTFPLVSCRDHRDSPVAVH